MDKVTGYVTGVNGNLVAATFSGSVRKNEVGYVLVGDDRLKGEVIRVNGDTASMQIYEMTNGIQVGDRVELSGELMSVELGPGLLTQVFDGLQNPLPELAQQAYDAAVGPKELIWIDTHNHIELYDHDPYVSIAAARTVAWLNRQLGHEQPAADVAFNRGAAA